MTRFQRMLVLLSTLDGEINHDSVLSTSDLWAVLWGLMQAGAAIEVDGSWRYTVPDIGAMSWHITPGIHFPPKPGHVLLWVGDQQVLRFNPWEYPEDAVSDGVRTAQWLNMPRTGEDSETRRTRLVGFMRPVRPSILFAPTKSRRF